MSEIIDGDPDSISQQADMLAEIACSIIGP